MSEHKIDAILTPEEKATLAGLVSVYPGIKDFVAGVIDRLSDGQLDEMLEHLAKPTEEAEIAENVGTEHTSEIVPVNDQELKSL